MSAIRRVYAYLLSLAGLAMLSVAAASLLQLLIDLALQPSVVTASGSLRDSVSLSAAAALVGLPVWLVHWLWIGRSVRSDPDERASTLRRLYLYAVLTGATLELVGSAREALWSALDSVIGPEASRASLDGVARPLPFIVIAACVWLAHWRIAASDRAGLGERGGSATLRRWYVYGGGFVGLVLLLSGAQGILESVWQLLASAGGPRYSGVAQAAADAVVGLGLWFGLSIVLPASVAQADPRDEDTRSVLRSVYLFGALAVGVIGCLLGLSQLLYYAVARALGVDRPGGVGGDLLQAAAAPVSVALVYGAAWAYQRQALRRQAAAVEAPRQIGVRRLYTYLVALVALGVLAGGLAGLLWTLGDAVFPDSAVAVVGTGWREQVALYATLSVVGLPIWLLHWRPRATVAAEARSLGRRLYLFLSLIAAMLALVGSAAAAVYRLLGLGLGGSFSVAVAADLAHALAVAGVGGLLAAYQWQVLRADARRSPSQPAPESHPTSEPNVPASTIVQLEAPNPTALAAALATLRTTGVQVTVLPSDAGPEAQSS